MANTDLTVGTGVAFSERSLHRSISEVVQLSFATNNVGAADTVTLIKFPGKCFVHQIIVDVTTAEGGTLTFDLGDNDGAATWFSNVNGNVVAAAASTVITAGKYFDSDVTFTVTADNAADTAVISFRFIITDLRDI